MACHSHVTNHAGSSTKLAVHGFRQDLSGQKDYLCGGRPVRRSDTCVGEESPGNREHHPS